MKTMTRASVALALLATLGMSAAFAQAPAQAPATAPAAKAPAATAAPAPATTPAGTKIVDDILTTASKAGNFKTLAKALDAADLTKVLQGKGPFTVFAPTDEAFAKIPKEQLDALLLPENKRSLASTLNAHVVAGKAVKSERFVAAKGLYLRMNNNSVLAVDAKDPAKGIKIGDALITKADIVASNGVIHVVDTVYVPKRVRAVLASKAKLTQAKAAAGPALEKAKEVGGKAMEKAKEVGGKAVEATKDAAGKAVDKAKEMTAPSTTPAPANK
jgi:uncharacterized surface protein with fasciclin (FAS1) repeats